MGKKRENRGAFSQAQILPAGADAWVGKGRRKEAHAGEGKAWHVGSGAAVKRFGQPMMYLEVF